MGTNERTRHYLTTAASLGPMVPGPLVFMPRGVNVPTWKCPCCGRLFAGTYEDACDLRRLVHELQASVADAVDSDLDMGEPC